MDGTGPADTGVHRDRLARALRRLEVERDALRELLAVRPVVDIATGMLAERLRCPPADAAAQLDDLAAEAGLPADRLAAEIVGATAAEGPNLGVRPAAGTRAQAAPPTEADTAARVLLDRTADLLAADTAVIWGADPGGGLTLLGHAGLTPEDVRAWRHVPPDVDTPALRAARSDSGMWPDEGPAATGLPTVGRRAAPHRLALPMRRRGRLLGALELGWAEPPRPLPAAARARLRALAEVFAVTVDTAPPAVRPEPPTADTAALEAVLDPALLLGPLDGRDGRVEDFRILRTNHRFRDPAGRPRHRIEGSTLLESYPLASSHGLLDRLRAVLATGEPVRERFVLTFLTDDLSRLPVVARIGAARTDGHLLVTWQVEDADARLVGLVHSAQRLARVGGFEEDLVTGDVLWNERMFALHGLPPDATPVPLAALAAHVHPDDRRVVERLANGVLQEGRAASAVFRLLPPGRPARYARIVAEPVTDPAGRVVLVRGAGQDVSDQHRTEVALAATRERLADSELEAAQRHRLTLRLQEAILPPEPPPLDSARLHAAVRYRPAVERERVGGDWYDILPLPDGGVLLSVGDLAGHGVGAATGMVALRNALRGLAVTGAGPARLLEWLNLTALALPDPATATAVCARFDPRTRILHWARAGHPPPVLLRAGRPRVLPLPRGLLLGAAPDAVYEELALPMEPDDVLLLYTDGLVERRGTADEESLRQLLVAAGAPGPDLGGWLDTLLEHSRSDTDDDTCLIAVRADPEAAA
ncbi:SpoIIE family protein phosphatase [Streptomyces sp. NRRL B-24484]|uniref:SpoIIE family protein phosphatase n=1 Tax=Streptomyces sp. NRRL B-24484 TaxID=1463833 RepID=UPI000693B4A9|nr:SpoIIE family protein phosphatase [Streptomyces sp. NRRL B-24484]